MQIKKLILGPMQTNCYVIINEKKECLIIDPGDQGQKVSKYIEDNELQIKGILLTHGHFDHIGAVDYLYHKYHCPIYTHKETIDLLHDSYLNLSQNFGNSFVVDAPIQEANGQSELAGFCLEWLLLEGHCQGSCMIHFINEKILFSGDVLFHGSIGRYDFPTSSHLEMKKTLEKIREYPFDARVLPGHGDETTLSFEKNNNPFLKS